MAWWWGQLMVLLRTKSKLGHVWLGGRRLGADGRRWRVDGRTGRAAPPEGERLRLAYVDGRRGLKARGGQRCGEGGGRGVVGMHV